MHREQHITIGRYFSDIIFAANDGIVTTFAVVAGVVGAHLSTSVILIIGIGNLIADGFSMATGNYLGTKSEQDLYRREERIEEEEIIKIPEHEEHEVSEILQRKGYSGKDLAHMIRLIVSNKKYWVDFMMHEEMGITAPEDESPLRKALVTFLSFFTLGSIPLLPYILHPQVNSFVYATIFTAGALFTIGALRSYFTHRHWLPSGLEMLFVGGSAATMAYLVGFALKSLVGVYI